jgi:thiol-disulfide isomerase/thioredoxin
VAIVIELGESGELADDREELPGGMMPLPGQGTYTKVAAAAAGLLLAGLMLTAGCKKSAPPPETPVASAPVPAPARVPVTAPPMIKKHLYPPIEDASADIQAGIKEARREHKRVILDFGGDWCGDCQVLDIYFGQAPNAELLAKNFVKVNVNIGRMDANLDVAHRYGVPINGVPALAVLDGNGKVLYSQNKEFSSMRYMEPVSVTDFLNKWKH